MAELVVFRSKKDKNFYRGNVESYEEYSFVMSNGKFRFAFLFWFWLCVLRGELADSSFWSVFSGGNWSCGTSDDLRFSRFRGFLARFADESNRNWEFEVLLMICFVFFRLVLVDWLGFMTRLLIPIVFMTDLLQNFLLFVDFKPLIYGCWHAAMIIDWNFWCVCNKCWFRSFSQYI